MSKIEYEIPYEYSMSSTLANGLFFDQYAYHKVTGMMRNNFTRMLELIHNRW